MTCNNFESYYVPKGWDYKEVKTKCGNTKYDGSRAICDTCTNDKHKMDTINRQERLVAEDNATSRAAGWGNGNGD